MILAAELLIESRGIELPEDDARRCRMVAGGILEAEALQALRLVAKAQATTPPPNG